MVQLKSFRYVEDGQGNELSDRVDETRQRATEDRAATASISSQSLTTIGGGNLTSSDSESIEQQQQQATSSATTTDKTDSTVRPTARAENNETKNNDCSDADGTTISSQEEYQMAEMNMSDDEEAETSAAMTRIEIVSSPGVPERGSIFPVPGGATPDIQRTYLSRAPDTSTVVISQNKLREQQQQQQFNNRSMSPALGRQSSGDNLSQYSMGQRTLNHFEIRWHDVNLFSRKSKVPKIIAQNPIYKLLTGAYNDDGGDEGDGKNDKVYYSPPIRHKMIIPTIKEDSELQGDSPVRMLDEPPFFAPDQNPKDYRPILRNVSGSVFSGQLTAILGPSGVGKTSLLNSLTGRNRLEGTGRVNLIGSANRKRMSVVTVPQADILPAKLTVYEDLQFTSRIKNPQPNFNHKRNIDRLVKYLHMGKFLYNRIEKLSGGEERRLSIARELLSSPDILILDEPTSGLDANTCKKIIAGLRDIVEHSDYILDRPMSVIITIHQPQQEVLNLFHRVYVMAIGGRAIYEGPPTSLLSTLVAQSSLGRVCAVDQLNENPAIVALEVASGEYGPHVITELAIHHESQFYEDSIYNDEHGGFNSASPFSTPRMVGSPRKSPLSATPRFKLLNRTRINQATGGGGGGADSIGRPTPVMSQRNAKMSSQNFDKMSNITSISFASSYDYDLPEPVSKLKVDKRLRRSVVMKSSFLSHTWTLLQRNWLLSTRDVFLMAVRIIGYFLVAAGIVQIFSHAIDPNQHLCPEYASEVEDVGSFMDSTKARLNSISEMLRQSSNQHTFFFHLVLCIVMVTSALTGLVFPMQMRMFMREYKNGWYSPASFITSNTLSELPVDFIGPTLSVLITYPLCNQPTSMFYWREIGYIMVIAMASNICKSQAQIVASIVMDSIENSVFLSCVAVTAPALLSGIATRVSQMSVPVQYASYGSFLRYTFESLFLLRYGLNMCPCDPELVKGYPTRIVAEAIPPQLDNLARGIIELNLPANSTSLDSFEWPADSPTSNGTVLEYGDVVDEDKTNLFVRYVHLVTQASNLFVQTPKDLGDCANYRSLYLMDMGVPNDVFPKWIAIILAMYVSSRFLTYFVVKAVIKLRRQ